MSLFGSLSTQDYCGQGRAITKSLDFGGGDEVGEQGKDVSINPGGATLSYLWGNTSSHQIKVQGN